MNEHKLPRGLTLIPIRIKCAFMHICFFIDRKDHIKFLHTTISVGRVLNVRPGIKPERDDSCDTSIHTLESSWKVVILSCSEQINIQRRGIKSQWKLQIFRIVCTFAMRLLTQTCFSVFSSSAITHQGARFDSYTIGKNAGEPPSSFSLMWCGCSRIDRFIKGRITSPRPELRLELMCVAQHRCSNMVTMIRSSGNWGIKYLGA